MNELDKGIDLKVLGAIRFRVLQVAQKWHLSETEHADLYQDTVGHVISKKFRTAAGAKLIADNFLKDWQKKYFNTRRIFRPLTASVLECAITPRKSRNGSEAKFRAVSRVLECLPPLSRKIVELFYEMGCPSWRKVAEAMGIPVTTFWEGPLKALRDEYMTIWKELTNEG